MEREASLFATHSNHECGRNTLHRPRLSGEIRDRVESVPTRFMGSPLVPVNTLWRNEPCGWATLPRSRAAIYCTGCERLGWSLALPGNASGSWGASLFLCTRFGAMNLAVWSTTKPPEGGTLTGREPDNAADHAERRPARVPRLRGKARFMGSTPAVHSGRNRSPESVRRKRRARIALPAPSS